MPAALRTHRLVRDFRGFRAVDRVDLVVADGSVHALVGPKRCGQDDAVQPAERLSRPTAGRVEILGHDVTGLAPERIAQRGVARSFQITSLFPQLTAREHVELALQRAGGLGWKFWRSARLTTATPTGRSRCWPMSGWPTSPRPARTACRTGANGRWNWPLALALEPRVLLLDEPTAGMGLEDIDSTVDLIGRVRADRTVVMVEHNMSVVASLADRVTVLQQGSVLVEGPYQEVRADERVITAYLGAPDAAR
jgi:branched-chain amino acid transport system ATP-binding protein